MIKIETAYPFQNLTKAIYEFYDSKLVTKHKSLNQEYEISYSYKDITKVVYFAKHVENSEINFGILINVILGMIYGGLISEYTSFFESQTMLLISKLIYIVTIGLIFHGLIKQNFYYLYSNDKYIARIKITRNNLSQIDEAIDQVKKNNPDLLEIFTGNPFPKEKPQFEFSEKIYNRFFLKSTAKYYKSSFIRHDRDWFGESVVEYKYADMNEDIFHIKQKDSEWATFGIQLFFYYIPFHNLIRFIDLPNMVDLVLKKGTLLFLGIFAISLLLSNLRDDYVYFINNNRETIDMIKITPENQDDVEDLERFIKKKISKIKNKG